MIRTATGAFATDINSRNLFDGTAIVGAGGPFASQRSSGATLVTLVNLPGINERWTLQSVGITSYLAILHDKPTYGRLGKLIAGLALNDPSVPIETAVGTVAALPTDPSLTVALFDPTVNEMPPSYSFPFGGPTLASIPGAFLAVSGILQLPQKLPLVSAEKILLGLWFLPSLIGFSLVGPCTWQRGAYRTVYTITYDDGLGG